MARQIDNLLCDLLDKLLRALADGPAGNLLVCNVSSRLVPRLVLRAPTTLAALAARLVPACLAGHDALSQLLARLFELPLGTTGKLRALIRWDLGLMLVNAIKETLGLPADTVVAIAAITRGAADACIVYLGVADLPASMPSLTANMPSSTTNLYTSISLTEFEALMPVAAPVAAPVADPSALAIFCESLATLVWAIAPHCEHGGPAARCSDCMVRFVEELRAAKRPARRSDPLLVPPTQQLAQARGEAARGEAARGEIRGETRGETARGETRGEAARGETRGETARGETRGETARGETRGEAARAVFDAARAQLARAAMRQGLAAVPLEPSVACPTEAARRPLQRANAMVGAMFANLGRKRKHDE